MRIIFNSISLMLKLFMILVSVGRGIGVINNEKKIVTANANDSIYQRQFWTNLSFKSQSVIRQNHSSRLLNNNNINKFPKVNGEWPDHINDDLLRIWFECDPSKKGHADRLHKIWCQEHRDYAHIDSMNLKARGNRLFNKKIPELGDTGFTRRQNMHWSRELEDQLLKMWQEVKNVNIGRSRKSEMLRNLWLREHPELPVCSKETLMARLHKLQREPSTENPYSREQHASDYVNQYNKSGLTWPEDINSDLERIWNECEPKSKGHSDKVYERWAKLHPDYANVTKRNLIERARRMMKRKLEVPPELAHKVRKHERRVMWTEKLDQDLLEIQGALSTRRFISWKEFHALWVKKNPELSSVSEKALFSRLDKLKRKSRKSQYNKKEDSMPEHFLLSSSSNKSLVSQRHDTASDSRQRPELPPDSSWLSLGSLNPATTPPKSSSL